MVFAVCSPSRAHSVSWECRLEWALSACVTMVQAPARLDPAAQRKRRLVSHSQEGSGAEEVEQQAVPAAKRTAAGSAALARPRVVPVAANKPAAPAAQQQEAAVPPPKSIDEIRKVGWQPLMASGLQGLQPICLALRAIMGCASRYLACQASVQPALLPALLVQEKRLQRFAPLQGTKPAAAAAQPAAPKVCCRCGSLLRHCAACIWSGAQNCCSCV